MNSEYKGGDSWVLDSECSSHMTSNSSFFSSYQKSNGRKATMGNEDSCPIVMLGSLCLTTLLEHSLKSSMFQA